MNSSDMLSSSYVVLDRRRFLTAAAGLVAVGLLPKEALALAGPHSFKQGALEITVVSDGHLVLPTSIFGANASPDELKAVFEAAGITGTEIQSAANPILIKSGSDLVLFDNGSGGGFQPTAGKLVENLKAAGVEPAAVTKIVFTHAHLDHVGGTLGADGALTFPNASYHAAAAEWDFWMADDLLGKAPAAMHDFIKATQRSFGGIKDKVAMFKPGDEIVGGIRALDTPGHTPGHVSFEVPGDDGLIIMGDVLLNTVTGFPHPEWHLAFDSIPDLAVETRKKMLDRAATDRIMLLGFHWAYPGIGYAERKNTAYIYVPAT